MAPPRKDLKGNIFGDLTVEKINRITPKGEAYWECRCICGGTHTVRSSHLVAGNVYRCRLCRFLGRCKGRGRMSKRYWNQVIRGAERRNLSVVLSSEEAYALYLKQNNECALTGVPITFSYKSSGTDSTASLDRIDSARGYVVDNVQWIHKDVNRMKMDLSEDKLLEWCTLLLSYRKAHDAHHNSRINQK